MRVSSGSLFAILSLAATSLASVIPPDAETLSSRAQGNNKKCKNPTVRPEWRTLNKLQKARWIAAVNVSITIILIPQLLILGYVFGSVLLAFRMTRS